MLLAPDLEAHSGALFNRKGEPIVPSPGLTDAHIREFMAESEALIARTGIQPATA